MPTIKLSTDYLSIGMKSSTTTISKLNYKICLSMKKKKRNTGHSRLPQASERCFRKNPNIPPSCTSDFFKLFGVLRKHCSEACGRQLTPHWNRVVWL